MLALIDFLILVRPKDLKKKGFSKKCFWIIPLAIVETPGGSVVFLSLGLCRKSIRNVMSNLTRYKNLESFTATKKFLLF